MKQQILWLVLVACQVAVLAISLGQIAQHRSMGDLHHGQYCQIQASGYPDYDHCITEPAQ